ncbi:hypothetical protein PV325_010043 [Microctonus aethiopoides]|nr:hypothetical protein PV325_010043 [Microctonus aethiopoides]KAK0074861.1 hypothetical protein PV326_012118 [Microctonus aethiopoides]
MTREKQPTKVKFHKQTLPIANFDEQIPHNKNVKKRHGNLLPNTIRAIFCGSSNCEINQEFKDIDQHAKFLGDLQQPITQEKMIAQQYRKEFRDNVRKKEQKKNFQIFACLSEGPRAQRKFVLKFHFKGLLGKFVPFNLKT